MDHRPLAILNSLSVILSEMKDLGAQRARSFASAQNDKSGLGSHNKNAQNDKDERRMTSIGRSNCQGLFLVIEAYLNKLTG